MRFRVGVLSVVLVACAADFARADVPYAWGYNAFGQVGDGTTTTRTTPVPVTGLGGDLSSIAGGGSFSLAIKNGAAYAWGHNLNGELGDSTNTTRSTPALVTGLGSGLTIVAGGDRQGLAVQGGALFAWGR